MRPRDWGFVTATAAFAIDQANKLWMLNIFDIGARAPIEVLPFLDIELAWNTGVSYSMFRAGSPWGRWLLVALALVVTSFFCGWLWRSKDRLNATALGLIVGAALANAVDRVLYGAVADFYHFHTPFSLGPLSNYVFNLADLAIVAGVGILLYESAFIRSPIKDV